MARAMWTGAISFGLVNVPVKLYAAARSKDVRFHQLHEPDRARIQMKRFCSAEDVEVPYDEIVKGYEIGPDEYVIITREELEQLEPAVSRGIEIEEFVDLADIDPVYFEHSYYLVPDKGGAKAYSLLRQAMEASGRVALGRVVLRQKQYLVALRATGNALAMSTLYYPDEVVTPAELEGLPGDDVKASDKEVKMAEQLIETLYTEFEPEKYRDEYREQLLELIEEKASGKTVVSMPAKQPAATKVTDLMAALEASIAAAKKDGGDEEKKPAKRKTA